MLFDTTIQGDFCPPNPLPSEADKQFAARRAEILTAFEDGLIRPTTELLRELVEINFALGEA